MQHRVRKILYSSLFFAILASGTVAGLGSVLAGVWLFRGYLERSVAAGADEAVRRARAFEVSLSSALSRGRELGNKALAVLSSRYPDMAHARSATMAGLRSEADSLGVDEIYLIGADGRIFSTSFAPDQGLDLFGFSPQFSAYLKGMLGTGREFDMEISGSTQTGNINNYQYFGLSSGELIIETSIRMERLVSSAYPGYSYKGFLDLYFAAAGPEGRLSPVAVEDYVDLKTGLSYIKENVKYPLVSGHLSSATPGAGLSWREGTTRIVLVPAELGLFWTAGNPAAILMRIDESYYYVFSLVSAVITFLTILAASILSFLGARRLIDRAFTRRLEALEFAMDKVGRGDPGALLEDGNDDELSSIGRSAASMVETILKDGAELRVFARMLEEEITERQKREAELSASLETNRGLLREVDHRVKNNLQLLASLSRLEADRLPAGESSEALGRMEARMRGLAMVEDQLTSNPSLQRIDMETLLSDIASSVSQGYPEAFGRVRIEIHVLGPYLGADGAVAVALSARELLDNALRHGFPGGLRGRIALSLESGPEGSFVLSVEDDGAGSRFPVTEGLGLSVARSVLAQRGMKLTLSAAGGGGFLAHAAPGASGPAA